MSGENKAKSEVAANVPANSRVVSEHRGQRKPKSLRIDNYACSEIEQSSENRGILPSRSCETTPMVSESDNQTSVSPDHIDDNDNVLPICPVCLECIDESVDGLLTILCNHAFHANCLIKWVDTTCPMCRCVQTPVLAESSVCMECEETEALWICLFCGHLGCGRYQGHAASQFRTTNHTFDLQLGINRVWYDAGDNFIHRLLQSKSDGKLVSTEDRSASGGKKIENGKTSPLRLRGGAPPNFFGFRQSHAALKWKLFNHAQKRLARVMAMAELCPFELMNEDEFHDYSADVQMDAYTAILQRLVDASDIGLKKFWFQVPNKNIWDAITGWFSTKTGNKSKES